MKYKHVLEKLMAKLKENKICLDFNDTNTITISSIQNDDIWATDLIGIGLKHVFFHFCIIEFTIKWIWMFFHVFFRMPPKCWNVATLRYWKFYEGATNSVSSLSFCFYFSHHRNEERFFFLCRLVFHFAYYLTSGQNCTKFQQ